jgi:metallo-beta-lactamase domain protein
MKLRNIKGNTYMFNGGTNTGVYLFENNDALLIDTGLAGKRQEKIIGVFKENNINVKYIINTHEHEDHIGGNYQIKKAFPDARIYSSYQSRVYAENPNHYMDYLMGGTRSKYLVKTLEEYMALPGPDEDIRLVDETIYPGQVLDLCGHKFKVINCCGHTEGSIGIVTDDGVFFISDLLVTKNSLDKFDFLFMHDYKEQMKSLDRLRMIDFEIGVLGHSRKNYSKQEVLEIANENHKALMRMIRVVLEAVKDKATMDDIEQYITLKNKLPFDYLAYMIYRNALNAVVSYLMDEEVIEFIIEDNRLYYKLKD